MGADSMEDIMSNLEGSTEPNKDTEQNLRDPETEENIFEQKIREIDKDLGFIENSINREPAIDTREDMTMQAMQAVGRKFQIDKQMGPHDQSQVYSSPSTVVSNVPKPSVTVGKNPQPTWKRLARPSVSSQVSVEESIGVKRPVEMVVDHYELPCKKLVVSCDDKENPSILAETGSQSRQSK
nr:hypothetical protein CFP56_47018 [Quercus suber]